MRPHTLPWGDDDVRKATFASTAMTAMTASILLAGLLAAGAVQAQLWRGPAALEIEAKDQKRGPVAGGEAKLVCRCVQPADGPPPVTLDAKGRAVVSGLAEGTWHVEVSKDGYMTYQADLDVRRDRKPKTLSTLQLNVPHAVHMMDVLFYRGKAAPDAMAAAPAAPAPERRRPAPPAPETQAETALKPASTVERVIKPVVTPEPSPPAPPAPATAPATPPSPAPSPRAMPPQPVPAPPRPAPASPAPVPQPSAAPTPMRHRSYEDRTCVECKPGESSLSAEAVVPPGAEGCGEAVRNLLARPGDAGLPAGCRVLRLTLPAGTRYTGYRYDVQEGNDQLDCQAGKDCPGGGRWPMEPAMTKTAAGTTVTAAFESSAAVTRERHAVLTVYYTAGKK